jgi:hypothetical protein
MQSRQPLYHEKQIYMHIFILNTIKCLITKKSHYNTIKRNSFGSKFCSVRINNISS